MVLLTEKKKTNMRIKMTVKRKLHYTLNLKMEWNLKYKMHFISQHTVPVL